MHLFDCGQEKILRWLLTEKFVTAGDRQSIIDGPAFRRYGPRLLSRQFFLAVLSILDYAAPDGHGGTPSYIKSEAILDAFCEGFPSRYLCYPFLHDGDLYVLVNLAASADSAQERVQVGRDFPLHCRAAREQILTRFGARLQLFVSPLLESFEQIELYFDDVRQLLGADLDLSVLASPGTGDIITQEMLDERMELSRMRDASLTANLEQGFYQAVTAREFDESYRLVCQLIDMESRSISAAISLKHRLCQKIESLYALLGAPYFTPDDSLFSMHQAILQMESSITIDDMKAQMNMVLEEFKQYSITNVVTPSARMSKIAAYIDRHYMDPALCANQICDRFDISMSYLSRAFKAHIGVKLIDYIHTVKLDAAKRQLLETTDTVEKIAADVGYQSALTFNRAFKRYEQTTPGVWRNHAYLNAQKCDPSGGTI